MPGRRKKGDTELVLALACGASPAQAAQKAGVSVRTVYRRLAEEAFRAQVQALRKEMHQRMEGMLAAAGLGSVRTLTKLQESALSESVRLGAARTTMELVFKFRELDLSERIDAVEASLEGFLQDRQHGGEKKGEGT
jgi:hypothetical protein